MNDRRIVERLREWPLSEKLALEAAARIEALEAEVSQLQAKLHCVCGSSVDHSDYEGHSPVSMYDYALDGANKRIEALENALRWINAKTDDHLAAEFACAALAQWPQDAIDQEMIERTDDSWKLK